MKKTVVVGVGDCRVSRDAGVELVTFALGSCLGVAIWDPVVKVGGLLHLMLPDSSLDREGGAAQPFRYADTGVPMLFQLAYREGAEKRRLVVRIVGGAAVVDDGGIFSIGKRNHTALRRILWKAGVLVQGEEVGGRESRTVRLEVATGRFFIREAGKVEREMIQSRSVLREGEAA
jgi:chemotaxis protein CheD